MTTETETWRVVVFGGRGSVGGIVARGLTAEHPRV